MKKTLTLIFCVIMLLAEAQVRIVGTVIDKNGNPLEGASVYLNNTTIGTTSDSEGVFSLSIKHGNYSLIASYLGFETSQYSLNTIDLPDEIIFLMFEKNNTLDEIVLNNKKRSNRRAYYLSLFRKNLLGQSFVAQNTRIKNEYAIKFQYDETNEILEASTIEPLIIDNNSLGYRLTYDLVHFKLQEQNINHLGYMRYEILEGNERKKRKWEKERELAYNGSLRHFLTSAIHKDTLSGFKVDKIKLIENPYRPTEDEILEAEDFVRMHGGLQRDPHSSDQIKRKLKLSNEILRKGKELNKFTEVILKKNIPLEDYFKKNDESMFLFSENQVLRITYKNEYQESNYKSPDETFSSRKHQVSRLTLLYTQEVLVNPIGLFHNPLDVLLEGYWAFERVADLVPIDYIPKAFKNNSNSIKQ